jgi:LPXTG-motif cell wall-anchored protein
MEHKDKPALEATGMDNDTTMALAAVGLAAAGLAVLIVMRKKRKQKELEQALGNDTQVGT